MVDSTHYRQVPYRIHRATWKAGDSALRYAIRVGLDDLEDRLTAMIAAEQALMDVSLGASTGAAWWTLTASGVRTRLPQSYLFTVQWKVPSSDTWTDLATTTATTRVPTDRPVFRFHTYWADHASATTDEREDGIVRLASLDGIDDMVTAAGTGSVHLRLLVLARGLDGPFATNAVLVPMPGSWTIPAALTRADVPATPVPWSTSTGRATLTYGATKVVTLTPPATTVRIRIPGLADTSVPGLADQSLLATTTTLLGMQVRWTTGASTGALLNGDAMHGFRPGTVDGQGCVVDPASTNGDRTLLVPVEFANATTATITLTLTATRATTTFRDILIRMS